MTMIAKLAMVAIATTTLTGCMHEEHAATKLPPGQYESTQTSTDANGTSRTTETTTDVKVDKYGNKSATVSKENTTDPKGLFNKSTTNSTQTYSEKH